MANGPTLPPQAYTREILAVAFQWLQSQPESIKKLAQSPDALVGLYLRAQRFGNQSPESDAPVTSQNFITDLKHLAEGLKQFEEPKLASRPGGISASQPTIRRGTSHGQMQMTFTHATQTTQGAQGTQTTHAAHASHTAQATHSTQTSHVGPSVANVHQAGYQNQSHSQSHSQSQSQNIHQVGYPNQNAHQNGYPSANSWSMGPVSTPNESVMTVPALMAPASRSESDLSRILNSTSVAMIHEVKSCLNLSSDAEVVNMMIAMAYKSCKNLLG